MKFLKIYFGASLSLWFMKQCQKESVILLPNPAMSILSELMLLQQLLPAFLLQQ